MALRLFIGKVQTSAHFHIKPSTRLWCPISHSFWYPLSSSSPSSSSFASLQSHVSSLPTLASAPCCGTCVYNGAQKDDWIISLAQSAVSQHNENQNVHLRFVRVVGASHTRVSSLLYYITLEAADAGKQKIYHAVIWMQIWKNLMELLVWKPVDDALSAVGVKRGDVKLHEAVMLYMNQPKHDHFPF